MPDETTTALIILAMHRTGSSALTGVLSYLGVNIGNKLLPPNPANPKGFFEHLKIVQIHDNLLKELGSSWHDPSPLPLGWIETAATNKAKKLLGEIIDAEFINSRIWAVKDPRICILLPLWKEILQERQVQPKLILTYREPDDIVLSLANRDGLDTFHSYCLWVKYMQEVAGEISKGSTALVSYDNLLTNWREAICSLEKKLEISWPTPLELAYPQIDDFIDNSLCHFKERGKKTSNIEKLKNNLSVLTSCIQHLERPNPKTNNDNFQKTINPELINMASSLNTFWVNRQSELKRLTEENHMLREETFDLQNKLALISASISWRITTPIRWIRKTFLSKNLPY